MFPRHDREAVRSVVVQQQVTDWHTEGMCRGNHAHLFFPPTAFERKDDRERRETRAKAICQVCPVLTECREYALTLREAYGIWGGMTESDRKRALSASAGR